MATESSDLKIESVDIKQGPGVDLNAHQRTLVGSVLDLFAGRPSLAKLRLWADDAVFEDPLAIARGRKQYEAQWYGLAAAFSKIDQYGHEVTAGGNPITIDMKTKYTVKGVGIEKEIESVVTIFHDDEGRITKVQDKWNGELPVGSIKDAFRRLNGSTMPYIVSVPKDEGEEAQKGRT